MMRSLVLSAAAFVLAFLALRAQAHEPQTQDPPPEEPPAEEPAEEETGSDERLTIDEMKALSDEELGVLYLETPGLLPENFGEDAELLERVMRIAHPEFETETETETEEGQSTQTPSKPKPKPDAR